MNHGPLVSGLVDVILHDEDEDEIPADPKHDSPALKQRVNIGFLFSNSSYLQRFSCFELGHMSTNLHQ